MPDIIYPVIKLEDGYPPEIAKTIIAFLKAHGVQSVNAHSSFWTYDEFVYVEYDDGRVQFSELRFKKIILYTE